MTLTPEARALAVRWLEGRAKEPCNTAGQWFWYCAGITTNPAPAGESQGRDGDEEQPRQVRLLRERGP